MNFTNDLWAFSNSQPVSACEEQALNVINGCNEYVHKILGVDLRLGLVILMAAVLREFVEKDAKFFGSKALRTKTVLDATIIFSAVAISVFSGLRLSTG